MINLNSFNVDSTYKVAGIKTFEGDVLDNKLLKPFDHVKEALAAAQEDLRFAPLYDISLRPVIFGIVG